VCDLAAVGLDLVLVVDDVALRLQVRAVLDTDLPPLPQRRDQRLVHKRHPIALRSFDLHGVAHVHDLLLDGAQAPALHVLEVEGLAEAERLSVQAEDSLTSSSSIQKSSPIESIFCRSW
jgi:hypothetical protein